MSKEKFMTDSQGRQVPEHLVSDIDKLRDRTVRGIIKEALEMRQVLRDFKGRIREEIFGFVKASAGRYGKSWGGKKGNITLSTYDGRYRLVVSVDEKLVFDERLQIARELIGGCINKWSKGSRDEIRILVQDAFQVDKAGKINTARVLGLRRLEIHDEAWRKAMRAITESIQVCGNKQYLRFYERNEQGGYEQIPLDVAAL
ncbi:MAG: DUF3164 family protein [Spirochaetales bacterium]|jgi:hypothetical protein|nr:DUF3164 family protein [Spirochaetales bacterium]